VFKDQSLHFPHDMRGNAAIPTKAHWIEPEFAFTLRTPNVDVGRLCALVGIEVKTKSAYSEYRWHPFKVLPLGHAGKFCSGQGGDVTDIPVRQGPSATSCQPLPAPASPCHLCHLCPTSLFTLPSFENLISSGKTSIRSHPTRGAKPSRQRVAVRGRRWQNLLPLGVFAGGDFRSATPCHLLPAFDTPPSHPKSAALVAAITAEPSARQPPHTMPLQCPASGAAHGTVRKPGRKAAPRSP
jgi:hypothetical protein